MTGLQLADCICMAGNLAFMIALGSSFARQQMATNGQPQPPGTDERL